jgi:GT2 family glycosyltransferase
MSAIHLSIIVINWNTCDFLSRCLQSVYDTVSDLDLETIVVDTASTDGSQAMVHQSFPRIRLIENSENVGFA